MDSITDTEHSRSKNREKVPRIMRIRGMNQELKLTNAIQKPSMIVLVLGRIGAIRTNHPL